MIFEVVLEFRFFADASVTAAAPAGATENCERDAASIAYLRASVDALMVENANLQLQVHALSTTAAPSEPPTPAPVPMARPEEFAIVVMTAFAPGFFPERARALQITWGHSFPRLIFVGVDSAAARDALQNEHHCSQRDVAIPDDPGAPTHAEFTCFDNNAQLKVVLLPTCSDDGHSPKGTSCKAQEGLLHVVRYEPTWFATANWFAVVDDDVFLWRSEFFRWAARIDGDPATVPMAMTPFGFEMHNVCKPFVNVSDALPKVPVPAMFGMVSRALLVRQVPLLLNGSLMAVSREFDTLHDVSWGVLMYNTRPWTSVVAPYCDARSPLACSNRHVFVHAIRVDEWLKPNLTCPVQVVQDALPVYFENSFERGASGPPRTAEAPPVERQLWSNAECGEFQLPPTVTASG